MRQQSRKLWRVGVLIGAGVLVALLIVVLMGLYRPTPVNPATEYTVYASGQSTNSRNYEFRVVSVTRHADGTITFGDYYERINGRWVRGTDMVTVSGYVLRQVLARAQ